MFMFIDAVFCKRTKKILFFLGLFSILFLCHLKLQKGKQKNKIDNPLAKLVIYGTEYLRTCLIENEKTNNTFVLSSLSFP